MIVAALLAVLATPATIPPVQSYDTYKSWFVACDNTLACVAKGFAEDANPRAEIHLEQEPGPDGPLSLAIRSEAGFRAADVRLDGQPIAMSPPWRLTRDGDGATLASRDPVAVRAMLKRLRVGKVLSLGQGGRIPLDGLSAALLRIEVRQGRVGTLTAVIRSGAAAATTVPAPPPIPRIPAHPIDARLAPGEQARLIAAVRAEASAAKALADCDTDSSMAPEADALDQRQALVLIPCFMGAYQGSSLVFVARRAGGGVRQQILPLPYLGEDPEHGRTDMVTEADFDPRTGMLSMLAKGRGLADCGLSASWIWDGAAFQLSAMRMQSACGGVDPDDWPILFESRR
jgi:hypothetical protein